MLRLPPNEAHRWWRCGASLQKDAGDLPVRNREAADQGVAAAKVAEIVMTTDAEPDDMIGWQHPNGVKCDADMARHVRTYVDIVRKWTDVLCEANRQLVWNQYDVIIDGRIDAVGWTPGCRRIAEFKFGFDPVDVFENKQLICYAIMDWFTLTDEERVGLKNYCLAVIQPRAQHPEGHYRRWTISIEELNHWYAQLNLTVEGIATGEMVQKPGEWCKRCTKAARCSALTQSVYSFAEDITGRTYVDPTGEQLSDELNMLERWSALLKARKSAVEAEVEARLSQQKFVPGWAIQPIIGKRKFKNEDPGYIQLMTGVDPIEKKLVTPAELTRRGAKEAVLKNITYQPKTGHKLERVDSRKIGKAFDD